MLALLFCAPALGFLGARPLLGLALGLGTFGGLTLGGLLGGQLVLLAADLGLLPLQLGALGREALFLGFPGLPVALGLLGAQAVFLGLPLGALALLGLAPLLRLGGLAPGVLLILGLLAVALHAVGAKHVQRRQRLLNFHLAAVVALGEGGQRQRAQRRGQFVQLLHAGHQAAQGVIADVAQQVEPFLFGLALGLPGGFLALLLALDLRVDRRLQCEHRIGDLLGAAVDGGRHLFQLGAHRLAGVLHRIAHVADRSARLAGIGHAGGGGDRVDHAGVLLAQVGQAGGHGVHALQRDRLERAGRLRDGLDGVGGGFGGVGHGVLSVVVSSRALAS